MSDTGAQIIVACASTVVGGFLVTLIVLSAVADSSIRDVRRALASGITSVLRITVSDALAGLILAILSVTVANDLLKENGIQRGALAGLAVGLMAGAVLGLAVNGRHETTPPPTSTSSVSFAAFARMYVLRLAFMRSAGVAALRREVWKGRSRRRNREDLRVVLEYRELLTRDLLRAQALVYLVVDFYVNEQVDMPAHIAKLVARWDALDEQDSVATRLERVDLLEELLGALRRCGVLDPVAVVVSEG